MLLANLSKFWKMSKEHRITYILLAVHAKRLDLLDELLVVIVGLDLLTDRLEELVRGRLVLGFSHFGVVLDLRRKELRCSAVQSLSSVYAMYA